MRSRPIHCHEGEKPPSIALMIAWHSFLSELCWPDQQVRLYSVRSRMQEHRGHATTGNITQVNFIEGASCLEKPCESSENDQEGKEASEQKQGEESTREGGTD